MDPVSSAPVLATQLAARPAPGAAEAVPGFALALTALLLPGAGEAGTIRQRPAATGKHLPEALLDGEDKSEPAEDSPGDEDAAAAAPFAWFATAPILLNPAPLGIQLPRPSSGPGLPSGIDTAELRFPGAELARAGFALGSEIAVAATTASPVATAGTEVLPPAADIPEPAAPVAAPLPAVDEAPAAPIRAEAPIRVELPLREPLRPAQLNAAPIVQPGAAPILQPLRPEAIIQPLAATVPAAIETGALAPPRRAAPRDLAAATLSAAAPAAEPVRAHMVAPTADAQQPVLDTRRHEWMTAMIDRIDSLRDAAGPRETNIRLAPDALGTVDVSIRQEGDRVHVRISAETPAARALLSEAQPRLAELAEARGLRLGQSSVDSGAPGQGGQNRQEAPRAPLPSAPPRAAAPQSETPGDARVA